MAPVPGRVLTESEQVVQFGTPILEIGDTARLKIRVDLLSLDAVHVRDGAKVQIIGWGGPSLSARVERIEPSASTRVSALGIAEQRVELRLALTGDPSQWAALGHGFRVVASITLWQGEDILSVPFGALFRDGSDWAVFKVQDGRAQRATITLGERNDEFAEVTSGLEAGDLVVLHPSDAVASGTAVRALSEATP